MDAGKRHMILLDQRQKILLQFSKKHKSVPLDLKSHTEIQQAQMDVGHTVRLYCSSGRLSLRDLSLSQQAVNNTSYGLGARVRCYIIPPGSPLETKAQEKAHVTSSQEISFLAHSSRQVEKQEESRKMALMNLSAGREWRQRCTERTKGQSGEGREWDE